MSDSHLTDACLEAASWLDSDCQPSSIRTFPKFWINLEKLNVPSDFQFEKTFEPLLISEIPADQK